MTCFSDEESDLLDRIAIDMELDRLSPLNRALVACRTAYHLPDDYEGPWPPHPSDTGRYVGARYLGKPLSATRVKHRTKHVLAKWRDRHHHTTSPVSTLSTTNDD